MEGGEGGEGEEGERQREGERVRGREVFSIVACTWKDGREGVRSLSDTGTAETISDNKNQTLEETQANKTSRVSTYSQIYLLLALPPIKII